VHQEILAAQRLPPECVGKRIFEERLQDIAAFERYLARNGITVIKFFLHVSRKEQRRRFLERIERPEKNWKFSMADVKERGCWKDYMRAYEDAVRSTASKGAPWIVVPADNKWFSRLVVAAAIVRTMNRMKLSYPDVDDEKRRELAATRRVLLKEK